MLQHTLLRPDDYAQFIQTGHIRTRSFDNDCECGFCLVSESNIGFLKSPGEWEDLLYEMMTSGHMCLANIIFRYLGKNDVHDLLGWFFVLYPVVFDTRFVMQCNILEPEQIRETGHLVQYNRPCVRTAFLCRLLDSWVLQHKREQLLYEMAAKITEKHILRAVSIVRTETRAGLRLFAEQRVNVDCRFKWEKAWVQHQLRHGKYHRKWDLIYRVCYHPTSVAYEIMEQSTIKELMTAWDLTGVCARERIAENIAFCWVLPRSLYVIVGLNKNPLWSLNPASPSVPVLFQNLWGAFPEYLDIHRHCPGQGCPTVEQQRFIESWVDRYRSDSSDFKCVPEDDDLVVPETPTTAAYAILTEEEVAEIHAVQEERTVQQDQGQHDEWEVDENDYGLLAQSQTMHVLTPEQETRALQTLTESTTTQIPAHALASLGPSAELRVRALYDSSLIDLTCEETETDEDEEGRHAFLARMDEVGLKDNVTDM
jgi:hypothetical protein